MPGGGVALGVRVIESFEVTGRGCVVVPDRETDLPVGQGLWAVLRDPSGRVRVFSAQKEWLLRRAEGPEVEVFVLAGARAAELPVGAVVELSRKSG